MGNADFKQIAMETATTDNVTFYTQIIVALNTYAYYSETNFWHFNQGRLQLFLPLLRKRPFDIYGGGGSRRIGKKKVCFRYFVKIK